MGAIYDTSDDKNKLTDSSIQLLAALINDKSIQALKIW